MGKSFDAFSSGLGVAGAAFDLIGIANGLIQGFVSGEIDSPEDFFNVLFGGTTDTFKQETQQALAEIQQSLDEISVDIRELGIELQTQIDAQTNLLLNVDIASLIGRADTIRTELSSYNPTALPGEIGYVSDADFDGFVRDLRRDSNEVLNQMTQIASTIITPRDGYTPNVNTLATAAAAVEYMAGIRLMIAVSFDRDELAARSLTDGLKQAAGFLGAVGTPIRSLVENDTSVTIVSETASGRDTRVNTSGFRTDEFNYTYTYYTVDASVGGASQSSAVSGVIENRREFNAIVDIDYDSNGDPILTDPALTNVSITRTGDSATGGSAYDVSFTDPSWNVDGTEYDYTDPALPALLRPLAIAEILDVFGLASGEDVFADLAGEFGAISNGIEDFRPDLDGNIDGSDGRDLLTGDSRDNVISGGGDNDTLRGRDGDDSIFGGGGNDLIRGDAGDDSLVSASGDDVIYGGIGSDIILGRAGQNMLSGDEGDDFIDARGLSTIFGGAGNDTLEAFTTTTPPREEGGQASVDTGSAQLEIHGGDGNDSITGGDLADTIFGGSGNDTISGGGSNDLINGGAGDDVIDGDTGINTAVFAGTRAQYVFDVTLDRIVLISPNGEDTIKRVSFFEFDDTTVSRINSSFDAGFSEWRAESGDEDDILVGGVEDDRLTGGGGDDTLFGGAGNDRLFGGDGDDMLYAGGGADRLEGGSGNDLLVSGGNANRLIGGSGDDTIDSTIGNDTAQLSGNKDQYDISISGDRLFIVGPDGNDLVIRPESVLFDDTFFYVRIGTENSETLTSPGGTLSPDQPVAYSGLGGDDVMTAGNGDDTIDGGAGDDSIEGGAGEDIMVGNDGSDLMRGGLGDDRMNSGNGDDALAGNGGNDLMRGDEGNDRMFGGSGADTMAGNDGDDFMRGGLDDDRMFGGSGHDDMDGEDGEDELDGGLGNDLMRGGAGEDNLRGDSGDDVMAGNDGNDIMRGGTDNDRMFGGTGADTLAGNEGDDVLDGGTEDDVLIGGLGSDTLTGGSGVDVFVFANAAHSPHGDARDVITDFEAGVDKIDLSGFGGLSFVSSYTGAGNELRYNDSIGRLYVDLDGDLASDFSVDLTGAPGLDAGDLIL